jgi:hypothetical protein
MEIGTDTLLIPHTGGEAKAGKAIAPREQLTLGVGYLVVQVTHYIA